MSEKKPYFIHHKAKKQSGEPGGVFWETALTDARAMRDADNALEDAGKDPANYFKAIVTNFPVLDHLPPEGEISFTFCDFHQLGDDGMTWAVIPGVTLPPHPAEKVVTGTDTTIVDGVDTTTGEILDASANTELNEETADNNTQPAGEGVYSLPLVSFNQQLLAQFASDEKHVTEYTWTQRCELSEMEMDTDNSYVQNLLLAASQHADLKKLDLPNLWKYTHAVKTVFPREKRQELSALLQFTKIWLETEYIDRGILVREWAAGKRISSVQRTESGANAGGGNKSDRRTPLTPIAQACEIAYGLLARDNEFDIYNIPLEIDAQANAILNNRDNPEFVATVELFKSMPGGLDFSRACNIATVKTTPENLYLDPPRHREHLNRVMTETDHANPDTLTVDIACGRSSMPMPMAAKESEPTREDVDKMMAEERGQYVEGVSDPSDPKWVDGGNTSNQVEKEEVETADNVQIQEVVGDEESSGIALQAGESSGDTGEETTAVDPTASEILAANAPHLADQDQANPNQKFEDSDENEPSHAEIEPEPQESGPVAQWPTRFEPGRYENVPNDVYHAANGISSTQLKDARISLMFYNARHVEKTIPREETKAFLFGGHSHAFILEAGKIDAEYAVPAVPPDDLIRTTSDMTAIIKAHNDTLPAVMALEEMKSWIEEYNSTLTPPLSLSAGAEETGMMYMSIPVIFQRIPADTKPTAAAQKACIKEYNATLPPMLKTSGSREQLLEQIATVSPELAEAERAKPVPYNVSGSRAQLAEIVRAIRPDAVLQEDFEAEQEVIRAGRTYISLDMYQHVKAIEEAVFAHPGASRLLNHENRQSEVSYFGFDEDTGLELRVRPDLEIQLRHARIGGDLKTIDLGGVKQERLRDRLHREIIERDYHLSAAMYCDVANLDQFYWIFVNKTPGYHWVVVVEASADLLELGRLEYRRTLRQINDAMATNNWPAPITDDYTDELNDFDLRRFEALSAM